ncbi:riboflavin kinase [Candidatus Uhrbacteria bacterium]|nr:riboflavin kinase [Candidatus Uhrbacteria bacterium]
MRELCFCGRVEKGEGMATRLGCPTANLAVEQGAVIPALGVYVGNTELEGILYPSLICINDGRTGYRLKIEVHLLDQKDVDLIGKHLNVVLCNKIRDLVPFPGEEEMAKIIKDDIQKAGEWFSVHKD